LDSEVLKHRCGLMLPGMRSAGRLHGTFGLGHAAQSTAARRVIAWLGWAVGVRAAWLKRGQRVVCFLGC
jgi:hypothetical protein